MRWFSLALLSLLALVGAPITVALALPFARQNPTNILPRRLQWLNTPDDPGCDQGMYEPQVQRFFARFGWRAKTWYWLGWRNQWYGLFAALLPKYDGSPVLARSEGPLIVYSVPGYSEWTWPLRRVSFGYKVHTLKTAKIGDTIWWVCMPAFWKAREY